MTTTDEDNHDSTVLIKKILIVILLIWLFILARICKKCLYRNDPVENRRRSSLIRVSVRTSDHDLQSHTHQLIARESENQRLAAFNYRGGGVGPRVDTVETDVSVVEE